MPPAYPPLDPVERDWSAAGLRASPEQIAAFRDELARAPDDPRLRTIVASGLAPRAVLGEGTGEVVAHLEWFVAHRPASRTMLVLCAMLGDVSDPEVRARVDGLLGSFAERTESATELGNVAHYFRHVEPDRARALLERAKALEPERAAEWDERLAQLGAQDMLNVRGRAATERAVGHALPRNSPELTRDDADALERRLVETPGDLVARAMLVPSYHLQLLRAVDEGRPEAVDLRTHLVAHVGWLIDHAPGSKQAGDAGQHVLQRVDPDGYADLSALWSRALTAHAEDAQVHANAAWFFTSNDDARALELLERAAELEPDEPQWSKRIAQHVESTARRDGSPAARRDRARRVYTELERAAAHEAEDQNSELARRFLTLPRLAWAALDAGEDARAEEVARDLMRRPADRAFPAAFSGQHEAYLVLATLAMRRGDGAAAAGYLRGAARERLPFRAQWAERLEVVRDLFDAGERDAVREYLATRVDQAERAVQRRSGVSEEAADEFFGRSALRAWLAALDTGERPAFPVDA